MRKLIAALVQGDLEIARVMLQDMHKERFKLCQVAAGCGQLEGMESVLNTSGHIITIFKRSGLFAKLCNDEQDWSGVRDLLSKDDSVEEVAAVVAGFGQDDVSDACAAAVDWLGLSEEVSAKVMLCVPAHVRLFGKYCSALSASYEDQLSTFTK